MWALAIIAAVVLGLPLLFTAAVHATWTPPRADPDAYQLPPGTGVRVFLVEWVGAILALLVRPFRLRDERRGGAGVILFVPEARCSSAAFWLLRRRLRGLGLGWSTAASLAAATLDGLDAAVAALDACIARLALPGTPLVVIGHGLGGLVARHYAATHASDRLRHVVTLATPHQGTTAPPYRLLGAGDLSPAALSLLARRAPPVDIINIAGDYDAWLVPPDHADCPGAFNITVRGLGHLAPLLSARVAGLIAENLAAPPPPVRVPSPPGRGSG